MSFLKACLDLDPANRLTCEELLNHEVFTENSFNQTFPEEVRVYFRHFWSSSWPETPCFLRPMAARASCAGVCPGPDACRHDIAC